LLNKFLIYYVVGFFGPLTITMLTEITPQEVRGWYMSLLTISLGLG